MTVVEITALAGVLVAVVTSIVIPVWLQRRKNSSEDRALSDKQRDDANAANVVSWQSITEAIQSERDRLLAQLTDIDERARKRALDTETDWERRMSVAQHRITDLEVEIASLRRTTKQSDEPGG